MIEFVLGFFTPWIVFALVLGLQLVVPARELKGYARDEHTGEPLTYRLNGFQVFIVAVAIWLVGGITGLVPFDWFWQHRWEGVAGALVLALPVSLAVLPGVPAQSDSPGEGLLSRAKEKPEAVRRAHGCKNVPVRDGCHAA